MPSPSILTLNLVRGTVAGGLRTSPVRRSNWERWRGQTTLSSTMKPIPRSVSSCVQTPLTAYTSPPMLATMMRLPAKSTALMEPGGSSERLRALTNWPTLPSLPVLVMPLEDVLGLLLFHFGDDLARERDERLSIKEATLLPVPLSFYDESRPLSRLLDGYPGEDGLEEAEDEHLLRFGFGEPPSHQVEDLLLVQLRYGGRVGRPHLVRRNLEGWHSVGPRPPVEDHRVMSQVCPRVLRRVDDLDHPLEDGLRFVFQSPSRLRGPGRILSVVKEVRLEVEPLLPSGEEDLEPLGDGAPPVHLKVHSGARYRGPEEEGADRNPCVLRGSGVLVRHEDRVLIEELGRAEVDAGPALRVYLDNGSDERGAPVLPRVELLGEESLRSLLRVYDRLLDHAVLRFARQEHLSQGLRDDHTFRDSDEGARVEERVCESRVLLVRADELVGEELPQETLVLLERLVKAHELNSLGGELLVELAVNLGFVAL